MDESAHTLKAKENHFQLPGHSHFSVELNQILRVNLIAVEDDVDLGVGHVVNAAVVEVGEAGVFGGRPAVYRVAHCVIADQHPGQEHGLVGRLTGENGRGSSVSLQGGAVLPCGVTEFTGVLGISGKVASCVYRGKCTFNRQTKTKITCNISIGYTFCIVYTIKNIRVSTGVCLLQNILVEIRMVDPNLQKATRTLEDQSCLVSDKNICTLKNSDCSTSPVLTLLQRYNHF